MTTYNEFLTNYANSQNTFDATELINNVKYCFKNTTGLSINDNICLNDLYNVIQSLWLVRLSVSGLYELSVALEKYKIELITSLNYL